jgi:hypothetical protein
MPGSALPSMSARASAFAITMFGGTDGGSELFDASGGIDASGLYLLAAFECLPNRPEARFCKI